MRAPRTACRRKNSGRLLGKVRCATHLQVNIMLIVKKIVIVLLYLFHVFLARVCSLWFTLVVLVVLSYPV